MQLTIDAHPSCTVMTIGDHITWPDTDQLITRINQMADSPRGLPALVLDVSHVTTARTTAAYLILIRVRRQPNDRAPRAFLQCLFV
ncbi:hypothetical protein [Nonomuraea sp. B19D2]|uniref:hypothetical protein n=1 Tax=Nonomuraea sp. B19D2 TaxID=3159561 RepID=UPI0032DAA451